LFENEGIDIEDLLVTSNKLLQWRCRECGFIWSTYLPNRTKSGSGCPRCSSGNHISYREYAIFKTIEKYYPDIISQYNINNMSFDMFIPCINTVIEYQGRYYHSNSNVDNYDVESRDKLKRKTLQDLNIRIITINETYNKEDDYIDNSDIYIYGTAKLYDITYKACKHLSKLLNINLEVDNNIDIIVSRELRLKDLDESLGSVNPDIAKLWDYDKNGKLTPFKVKPKSNKLVWWKCTYCNYSFLETVAKMTERYKVCSVCNDLGFDWCDDLDF